MLCREKPRKLYYKKNINGSIVLEEEGKVHHYHEKWKLVISINTTNTQPRFNLIANTLQLAIKACDSQCAEDYEIKTIGERYERLRQKDELLQHVMGTRRSNIEEDLETISKEFDQLYLDNRNLAMVMQNHTKIQKLVLDSSSTDYKKLEGKLQAESAIAHVIRSSLNNTRNLFVISKLISCEILIKELHHDIETALAAINNSEHGKIHPQILTPKILMDTIKEFEAVHRTRYHFDTSSESYQHIIDLSEVNPFRGTFFWCIYSRYDSDYKGFRGFSLRI